MAGPFLEEEDDVNDLADFGAAGGGIPNAPSQLPKPPPRRPRRGFQGSNAMYSPDALAAADFAARVGQQHQSGVNSYQDHLNTVSKTIGDELKSRVAQAREMRRMEHERAMKKMDLDAILARLEAARKSRPPDGPTPRAVFPGGAIY
jgi:hypothetical protein